MKNIKRKTNTTIQTKRKNVTNIRDLTNSLSLAQQFCLEERESDIIATLEPFETLYPFDSNANAKLFDILLAYAYANANQLLNAEMHLDRALKNEHGLEREQLDILYVRTFVKLKLREYQAALQAGRRYIELMDESQSRATDLLFTSLPHKMLVYNMLGVASRGLNELKSAESSFQDAITTDQSSHLPFLNLANLLIIQRRFEEANDIITNGIDACGQIQELRMLKESLLSRPTISACMIVKDEEELLPGCLKSIRDWVDEIIIVDTGSTDKTIEIAKSFGAKLFHQPWEGNFSKHRNYSLEQASSEWVFIIDADERMVQEDIPLLQNILKEKEHSIISLNVINVYGKGEETTTFLPSTRLWRRDLNYRYDGIVHNILSIPDKAKIVRTNVNIKHLGYDLSKEKMAKKMARSRTLLESQLAENPDNSFALFNYAQLLRGMNTDDMKINAEQILKSAGRAVELTDPHDKKERHIHLMCLNQLAWTNFFSANYELATSQANRAIELKPNYLDPLLLLGHIHTKTEDYAEAKKAYRNYIAIQTSYNPSAETENIIVSQIDSRENAYYALGMIGELEGDSQAAKQNYQTTLKLNPRYLEANSHLGRLYFSDGNFADAETCFLNQLSTDNESQDATIGLANIYALSDKRAKADSLYKAWLERYPDDQKILCRYARFCIESDRPEESDQLLQRISSLGDGDIEVRQSLAEVFFTDGNFLRAKEILKSLVASTSEPNLLNDLGNCCFKLNQMDEALEWYQKASNISPVLPISLRNLGLTLARQGRIEEAIEEFKIYLEHVPEDLEIDSIVGDILFSKGEHSSALPYYERLLASNPDNIQALFKVCDCYLHMGHSDSALLGYRRILQIDPEFHPAQERLATLSQAVGQA